MCNNDTCIISKKKEELGCHLQKRRGRDSAFLKLLLKIDTIFYVLMVFE
jgi:hypothetical protein